MLHQYACSSFTKRGGVQEFRNWYISGVPSACVCGLVCRVIGQLMGCSRYFVYPAPCKHSLKLMALLLTDACGYINSTPILHAFNATTYHIWPAFTHFAVVLSRSSCLHQATCVKPWRKWKGGQCQERELYSICQHKICHTTGMIVQRSPWTDMPKCVKSARAITRVVTVLHHPYLTTGVATCNGQVEVTSPITYPPPPIQC